MPILRDKLAITSTAEFENCLFRATVWTRRQLEGGVPGEALPYVLEYIRKCLDDLWKRYQDGALPPKGERSWGPGQIVIDRWRPDDPYGQLLLRIGIYYRKKL